MRIVIDMQGAQTSSRFRGIGRYTISLTQAICRNRGHHEVILVLNGMLDESIQPIRCALAGTLPQDNIRIWHAPGPVREEGLKNNSRRHVAEVLREAFIQALEPDVVLLSSLFEGYMDDAITSIEQFDQTTPVAAIFYDLIPLLNPEDYLKPNARYSDYYLRKIEHLKKAAAYLAISEFSRHECIANLATNSTLVTNISTAIDSHFKPVSIPLQEARKLHVKFGIGRPFIFYTGGSDQRKNLPRLLDAFALLPKHIRDNHQLIFAGRFLTHDIDSLNKQAADLGLTEKDFQLTGYVSDAELVALYNLCSLFVFPSWHEGFGLPALEAMACGTAVIGANAGSLPEVIAMEEALFDPFSSQAICNKIQEVLENPDLLNRLKTHGPSQATRFSWDATAQRAITALEKIGCPSVTSYVANAFAKQNLLTKITADLDLQNNSDLHLLANCVAQNELTGVRRQLFVDISELCRRDAATGVQRVVRSYLRELLHNPPQGFCVQPVYATVGTPYKYAKNYTLGLLGHTVENCIDDPMDWQRGDLFFALDMQHHVQIDHGSFFQQLRCDGVTVKFLVYDLLPIELADSFADPAAKRLHEDWLAIVGATDGAICISQATANALRNWFALHDIKLSTKYQLEWVHCGADIENSSPSFGMPPNAQDVFSALNRRPTFLCVSTIEPRKQQNLILDAMEHLWEAGVDANLVLVGKLGWSVDKLAAKLKIHPELNHRLFWLDGISDEYLEKIYRSSSCLIAASINEGFGLSLIEAARHNIPLLVSDINIFREVAGTYASYFKASNGLDLSKSLKSWLTEYASGSHIKSTGLPWLTWKDSACRLKEHLLDGLDKSQLLVDISELVQHDAKTGIQRVVRSILLEWLDNPPPNFRVEPVFAAYKHGYRYARSFIAKLRQNTNDPKGCHHDDAIDFAPGDVFIGLDLNHHIPRIHQNYLDLMRDVGVKIYFIVYDLLPIQFPDFWEKEHSVTQVTSDWLSVISRYSGAVCISRSVAYELRDWIRHYRPEIENSFKVEWFHLGADVNNSMPTKGLPTNYLDVLDSIKARTSFLMVGTLEPRKGHAGVLDAFEKLWSSSVDASLVIVGKRGWLIDDFLTKVTSHPELGLRLFWLDSISDEYLDFVYNSCDCLIAASYGEGFGLPLIEAAQHELPILARDIPVFREVAGKHALYFNPESPDSIFSSVKEWLKLYGEGKHPSSHDMHWLTWKESATDLLSVLLTAPEEYVHFSDTSRPSDVMNFNTYTSFPISPALPLPLGATETTLFDFVTSVRVKDAPEAEMKAYGTHDFKRFVYTWGLAQNITGKCLELGANPYFTTMLLAKFTNLELSLANYFGHSTKGVHSQFVEYTDIQSKQRDETEFKFQHFNVENDAFPYSNSEFDLVIFAEIIEHLLNDPCNVLREIKRVLKPGGSLILTTPNVARLENVARLAKGVNIYDPYSGYGPYGRHNREYTLSELKTLLEFEGFDIATSFTADVHANNASSFCSIQQLAPLIKDATTDRGQYIFIKATSKSLGHINKRPSWLYRSYPDEQLL